MNPYVSPEAMRAFRRYMEMRAEFMRQMNEAAWKAKASCDSFAAAFRKTR